MKTKIKNTLLLVGNSSSDRAQLHTIFESDYNLLEAANASQGVLLLKQNIQHIAAVITDIVLTKHSGLKNLIEICHNSSDMEIPVICIVTPTGTGQREETALLSGADDVVTKPYTSNAIRQRVHILIDLYLHRWNLETLVQNQSRVIRHNNQVMIDTLSSIIEYRSTESGNHTLRIRRFVKLLLQEVASYCPEYNLNEESIDQISSAAALHDIGKIAIPDNILNKPGPLTDEEFESMKTHTTLGAQLVEQIGDIGDPLYLRYIYNIALYHHERWDGKGYPQGLAGQEIPMCAHVVGLVDVYDALTNPRVYKEAFSHEKAVNMILNGECGAFSPRLLECFKHVRDDFKKLSALYSDGYSPKSDQIRVPLPTANKISYELSALELSQLKYLAILHHLDDTVIELDIDKKSYHVVYNPNPDFVNLFSDANFEDVSQQLMKDGAHPKNATSMQQMRQQISQELFGNKKRKISFECQIFSHTFGEYYPYKVTLLRVDSGVPNQRLIIAIFHSTLNEENEGRTEAQKKLPESPSMFGLSSGALCCQIDDGFPIDYGMGSLMPLTGFTSDDIRTQFGGCLLNMIYEDDREAVNELLNKAKNNSSIKECQCRIICKDREPAWVMGKLRMAINSDGRDVFYILFMDISSIKERENALMRETKFHQALTQLSQGVLLSYDIKTRTLTKAEHWEEQFGYPIETDSNMGLMDFMPHIHPDDVALIQSAHQRIISERVATFEDVRIADSTGKYLWCRIRCKSDIGSDGQPERITAIIYDIDDLKSDALAQKKKAEYDGLTKLLNKNSAKYVITEYLKDRRPDELAGMLVLDLDNFKAVNDTLGHLYGDAVLTQIGITLKTLFRPQDIVGRIGGDEFLILMVDVPNAELVMDRCQLMVDTFCEMLHTLMPKLSVSISVGAAIAPNHGTEYAELFRRADSALYMAKRNGKNQYHMYDVQDDLAASSIDAMPLTLIDTREAVVPNDESFVRLVFKKLYESNDIDATINELLEMIGIRFNVSRVYIFENSEDNTTCSNTFEWCNNGIEPQIDTLQNLSYETDLVGLQDAYDTDNVLYYSDIREMQPNLREIVEPQGIKSMLHCAIMDKGVFRGYIGFDECTANYLWTQGQVSLLQFMAEVLAVFLIKQRALERLTDNNKNI